MSKVLRNQAIQLLNENKKNGSISKGFFTKQRDSLMLASSDKNVQKIINAINSKIAKPDRRRLTAITADDQANADLSHFMSLANPSKSTKNQKLMSVRIAYFQKHDGIGSLRTTTHEGIRYKQMSIQNLSIPSKSQSFFQKFIGKYIKLSDRKSNGIIQKIKTESKEFKQYFDKIASPIDLINIIASHGSDMINDDQSLEDYQMSIPRRCRSVEYINHPHISNASKKHQVNNECFLNAFLNRFEHTFGPEKKEKKCNRDILLRILKKTEDNIIKGVSMNEMTQVFDEYDIPVQAYDSYNKIIYERKSKKKSIPVFYIMLKNNHVYLMDTNTKSITWEAITDITLNPSSKFGLPKEKDMNMFMVSSFEQIVSICKEQHDQKEDETPSVVLFIAQNDIESILFDFRNNRHEPAIKFVNNKIASISFCFSGVIAIIKNQDPNIELHDDSFFEVDNMDTYKRIYDANKKFQIALLDKNHLSNYDENDTAFLKYRSIPIYGMTPKCKQEKLIEIDVSKAYTSALMEITKIPHFNVFDKWTAYDGADIEDYNIYLVETTNNIFFQRSHQLIYGMFLKQMNNMSILYVKRPSNIFTVDYKKLIDTLYATHISDNSDEDKNIKKLIANVSIGLLEKLNNKASMSKIFTDSQEANLYRREIGGSVIPIFQTIETNEYNHLDGEITTSVRPDVENGVYIHQIEATKELEHGFVWIKELLMEIHNFKMFNAFQTLTKNKIKVHSVKTDAFTIDKKHFEKVQTLLSFEGIGNWRFSKMRTADIVFPSKTIELVEMKTPEFIPLKEKQEIIINDEWDTDAIVKQIIDGGHKRVMIRAKYAGSGKSFISSHMPKATITTPSNKLCQKFLLDGAMSCTYNKFFGYDKTGQEHNGFDTTSYDTICFDEILFVDMFALSKVQKYIYHSNKFIVATGDDKQLENFAISLNNITNKKEYLNKCIDSMFDSHIYLKECKRVKTDEDKQKIVAIYDDIFINKMDVSNVLTKYFKPTNKIMCDNNITFFNETAEQVATIRRRQLELEGEYEIDEHILCKHYVKDKKNVFNQNFEYVIHCVFKNEYEIKNVATNEIFTISKQLVANNFISAFASTCHSFQGSSVDENITIFDYKCNFINPEWLYVAITRSTDLNKVYYYNGPNLFSVNVCEFAKRKITGYKEQDAKASRPIANDYLNVDWFFDCLKSVCYICNEKMSLKTITADRLNNDLAHTVDNCKPCCLICNCTKK